MTDITITIPDDKVAEFKLGFLKLYPVPLDAGGSPIMAENAWIKAKIAEIIKRDYQRGKIILNRESLIPPEDILIT